MFLSIQVYLWPLWTVQSFMEIGLHVFAKSGTHRQTRQLYIYRWGVNKLDFLFLSIAVFMVLTPYSVRWSIRYVFGLSVRPVHSSVRLFIRLSGQILLQWYPMKTFDNFDLIRYRGQRSRSQQAAEVGRWTLPFSCPHQHSSRQCVGVSVYLHSSRKTASAINTKLGTRILYSSRSARIDPEIKRSKVKVTWLRQPSRRTVAASDHGPYSAYPYAAVLPAAVAGVGLHVDTTAYVS